MAVKKTRKPESSLGQSESEKPEPAFRAGGLSAFTEAQREMAQAISDSFGLAAQASKELMERQGAYISANQEILRLAIAASRDGEPEARLARQSECYRQFVETSVRHLSDVLKTASEYCCSAVDRVAGAGAACIEKASKKSGG